MEQILVGVILLIFAFTLAGCWDRVELENRAFAVAMGIDVQDGQFEFAVASARSESNDEGDDEDKNNEDDEEAADKQPAQSNRLIEAIQSLDASSSRKLFLGQAKTAVFGKNLLKDENLFREAIYELENRSDIDRSISVLATTSKVTDIINASPSGEEKPGYYVVNFHDIAPKTGGKSFNQNFELMMAGLRETSGSALLPLIEIEKEEKIAGAAVIKNYQFAGEMDGIELRGLLWAKSGACKGAIITSQDIPMTVHRHRSNMHFSEENGTLRTIIEVHIKGEVADFWGETPPSFVYDNFIAKEMETSIEKIQQELEVDALSLRRALQKKNYRLYQRYADSPERWEQTFVDMKIVPVVSCSINR